jgi:hypothetical protein
MTDNKIGSHVVHKWRLKNGVWVPVIIDDLGMEKEVVWAPQAGSQDAFLSCPTLEVLYSGTRGPGKTDALLMDFAQHVGCGYGANWVGIIFRHSHPELRDIIEKSKHWYPLIFKGAFYNEIKFFWEWPTGERLYFSHFDTPTDYTKYHGHAFTWIGWEELTSWNTPDCYKSVFSLLRSTVPGIPKKIRATTNPHGVGHNWVKSRFRITTVDPKVVAGPVISDAKDIAGHLEPPRQVIFGFLEENKILLKSDPDYVQNLRQSARSEAQLQAWLYGSWDIVAGGMFDDIWHGYKDTILLKDFVPPPDWPIYRAYDHGSTKPFSVGWYTISDGSDIFANGKVRATLPGDLFRIREWYGWRGKEDEGTRMLVTDIARGIIEREIKYGWRSVDGSWCKVKRGPADTSIFDENNGVCIADDFERPVHINGVKHRGIVWERADKGPGSRQQGWEQIRRRLKATKRLDGEVRETPGLFILEPECYHWCRTVPVLPRDEIKVDDVDTKSEDHVGDETRYMLRYEPRTVGSRRVPV